MVLFYFLLQRMPKSGKQVEIDALRGLKIKMHAKCVRDLKHVKIRTSIIKNKDLV